MSTTFALLGIEANTYEPLFAANGSFAGTIQQVFVAGPWFAKKRGETWARECDCRACAVAYVLTEDVA